MDTTRIDTLTSSMFDTRDRVKMLENTVTVLSIAVICVSLSVLKFMREN